MRDFRLFVATKKSYPKKFDFVERLSNNIGQECHKARAFDRLRERALVACREAGAAARHNFAMRVEELFQSFDVFVIDCTDLCAV